MQGFAGQPQINIQNIGGGGKSVFTPVETKEIQTPAKHNKPLWEMVLEDIKSPYITDAIKLIIDDSISDIENGFEKIYKIAFNGEFFTCKTDIGEFITPKITMENFYKCSYLAMYLDTNKFYEQIKSLPLKEEIYEFFMAINSFIKSEDIEWCQSSSPFKYIFDGRLVNVPKGKEFEAIKPIQEVFGAFCKGFICEYDPKNKNLELLQLPEELKYIKANFLEKKAKVVIDKF